MYIAPAMLKQDTRFACAVGQFQNFLLGRQGADIRSQNLGTALGTAGFANIGLPGTQTQGILGQLGGSLLQGAGAAGGFGALFS